ncbi:hypothetical protein EGW08_020577, partial [Elysia chlorotica]
SLRPQAYKTSSCQYTRQRSWSFGFVCFGVLARGARRSTMCHLNLTKLLLLAVGILSVTGAPIATDGGNKAQSVQNISMAQTTTTTNGVTFLTQQSTTKTPAMTLVSGPTPEPKSQPSNTFIKTVEFPKKLLNFFRPRLVDNLLKHEAYQAVLSDPMVLLDRVQFNKDPEAGAQHINDPPQVRPLAAPVLTLVPVLLTPDGSNTVELEGGAQDQGSILIPVPQPPSVDAASAGATPRKNGNSPPGNVDDMVLQAYGGAVKQEGQQQPLQKTQSGPSDQETVTPEGTLILRPYGLPLEANVYSQNVQQSAEEKAAHTKNQQEDPYYIYSLIPTEDREGDQKVGRLGTEVNADSIRIDDGFKRSVKDEDTADIIYDEAPAFYYYLYYDDDDDDDTNALEGDKKNPQLQKSPALALSADAAAAEKNIDLISSKAKWVNPKGPNKQASSSTVTADAYSAKLKGERSDTAGSPTHQVLNAMKEDWTKTPIAGERLNVKRTAEEVEQALQVE